MGLSASRTFPSELLPDEAHVVQFYTDDSVLLDGLASSFGKALRAGESVVVVMTKSHEKGIRKRLTAQGINLKETTEQGRFIAMETGKALDLFMERGSPNRQKFLREFGEHYPHGRKCCGRQEQASRGFRRDGRRPLERETARSCNPPGTAVE